MDVYVDKTKCTGCQHCFDVCPVGVFVMKGRGEEGSPNQDANTDSAPDGAKWTGAVNPDIKAEWQDVNDGHKHFAKDSDGSSGGLSVAVNGSACILCQACLIECEGECIHITDDTGTKYQSIYK